MRLIFYYALSLLLLACGDAIPVATTAGTCSEGSGIVTKVIDGDTVDLKDGRRIRYLLIDAPELGDEPECFAEHALDFNRQLVLNKEINLQFDAQCFDNFGRTLAYVSIGKSDINKQMLDRGFAKILFIPPNGEQRLESYRQSEHLAQNNQRGLWQHCGQ